MKSKKIMLFIVMLACMTGISAQTDQTGKITNPSFESEFNGWEHKSMSLQGNSVFSIKEGATYVEKWTGRGGAVGSGLVSQTLSKLPPGNYELTAAAQNIQEDTPTAKQSGAWIFAGENKTTVNVRNTYKVAFDYVSGDVAIGFEAVNATGNWIAVDNFRLTLVGTDLSKPLNDAIEHAVALYGEGTGKQAEQLKAAIDAARATASNPNATGEEQANAIITLQQAEDIYLRANASADEPLDMTSTITNPSFETGDFTGWKVTDMAIQGNSVFSIKNGTYYTEKWTGRGGAVGDAKVSQTISGMEPGLYRLKVAAQNIQEDYPKTEQKGAWIYANSHRLPVNIRQEYVLDFVLVSNQLEIGFLAEQATGNWLSVDNFRLFYLGEDFETVKAELVQLIEQAEQLATQKMNSAAAQALATAIAEAKQLLSQTTTDNWGEASKKLEAAYATAVTSCDIFAQLAQAIGDAQAEIDQSSATDKTAYQDAINSAQAVYDNADTTDAMAKAAIEALQKASFEFKIATGSEEGPKVTTDKRFIRGATWAFGRSTVNGNDIIEQGFCWAEHPDP
jgi:hypothetical protein